MKIYFDRDEIRAIMISRLLYEDLLRHFDTEFVSSQEKDIAERNLVRRLRESAR